jgi:hypothetical protein
MQIGNKVCDPECQVIECSYDAADCGTLETEVSGPMSGLDASYQEP